MAGRGFRTANERAEVKERRVKSCIRAVRTSKAVEIKPQLPTSLFASVEHSPGNPRRVRIDKNGPLTETET
jgi:hypothetical protein